MSATAIIMMVVILGTFFGGFSVMVYKTLTTENKES